MRDLHFRSQRDAAKRRSALPRQDEKATSRVSNTVANA
jgi:hypothetical protein